MLLQCVCSAFQCVAGCGCFSEVICVDIFCRIDLLQCVAVSFCSVFALCCSMLQDVVVSQKSSAWTFSVENMCVQELAFEKFEIAVVAECCIVLQCAAVCCSVLQCVAVCCAFEKL